MSEGRVHDIGGDLGYGQILHDPEEPVFHYEWERRVFGVMFQVLRITAQRPGEMRYAIERLAEEDVHVVLLLVGAVAVHVRRVAAPARITSCNALEAEARVVRRVRQNVVGDIWTV